MAGYKTKRPGYKGKGYTGRKPKPVEHPPPKKPKPPSKPRTGKKKK